MFGRSSLKLLLTFVVTFSSLTRNSVVTGIDLLGLLGIDDLHDDFSDGESNSNEGDEHSYGSGTSYIQDGGGGYEDDHKHGLDKLGLLSITAFNLSLACALKGGTCANVNKCAGLRQFICDSDANVCCLNSTSELLNILLLSKLFGKDDQHLHGYQSYGHNDGSYQNQNEGYTESSYEGNSYGDSESSSHGHRKQCKKTSGQGKGRLLWLLNQLSKDIHH